VAGYVDDEDGVLAMKKTVATSGPLEPSSPDPLVWGGSGIRRHRWPGVSSVAVVLLVGAVAVVGMLTALVAGGVFGWSR